MRAEGEALISEIEGELKRLSVQDEELAALRLEATEVRPWGAFDPAAVSQLSEAGYALSFFTILKRALPRHSKRSMMSCPLPRSQVESISFNYMLLELHRLYQQAEHVEPLPNVALQNSRDL